MSIFETVVLYKDEGVSNGSEPTVKYGVQPTQNPSRLRPTGGYLVGTGKPELEELAVELAKEAECFLAFNFRNYDRLDSFPSELHGDSDPVLSVTVRSGLTRDEFMEFSRHYLNQFPK